MQQKVALNSKSVVDDLGAIISATANVSTAFTIFH